MFFEILLLVSFVVACECSSFRFDYTGSVQIFTVPDNINELYVEIIGGSGGSDFCDSLTTWNGGLGYRVYGKISITKSIRTFFVNVGGMGENRYNKRCYSEVVCKGGYNGGGHSSNYSGGGGGGSSDIRIFPSDLKSRIIVAGGGGGASAYCHYHGDIF